MPVETEHQSETTACSDHADYSRLWREHQAAKQRISQTSNPKDADDVIFHLELQFVELISSTYDLCCPIRWTCPGCGKEFYSKF